MHITARIIQFAASRPQNSHKERLVLPTANHLTALSVTFHLFLNFSSPWTRWKLLETVGDYWKLLEAVESSCRLLESVECCWKLLEAVGYSLAKGASNMSRPNEHRVCIDWISIELLRLISTEKFQPQRTLQITILYDNPRFDDSIRPIWQAEGCKQRLYTIERIFLLVGGVFFSIENQITLRW